MKKVYDYSHTTKFFAGETPVFFDGNSWFTPDGWIVDERCVFWVDESRNEAGFFHDSHSRKFITLAASEECPLDTQLELITGSGWCLAEWSNTLNSGWIRHLKSGLIVKVL